MAPKLLRSVLTMTFLMTALAAMPPVRVMAADSGLPDTAFPGLGTFRTWINNGHAAELRGVYVPNILADSVVQQPENQATFVSPRDNVITQFGAASSVGSTGLLAHNFLAGSKFPALKYGQLVYLVYGDGHISVYSVRRILQYQALEPESPYSDFVDLSDGRSMSSGEVFKAAYARPGAVVFQTCIASDGNSSWGRLFVIAEPFVAARNTH
jgi:hypothetical protein